MKESNYLKKAFLLSVLVIFTGVFSWAQMPEKCKRCEFGHKGLNLNEDQKDQIKTLRLEFIKELTPLKNDLQIKKAQLHAKSVGDNVDIKSVNKLIDEIGDIKTQIEKNKFAHKLKVRNVLTEEQRVIFDSKPKKSDFMGKQGHGHHNKSRMMHEKSKCGGQKAHFKDKGEKKKPDTEQKEIDNLD